MARSSHATSCARLKNTTIAGYDADLVILVNSDTEGFCTANPFNLARAGALLVATATGRPLLGQVLFCNVVVGDFEYDLATITHELLHILVSFPVCMHHPAIDTFEASVAAAGETKLPGEPCR